jgi:hypothetical protein
MTGSTLIQRIRSNAKVGDDTPIGVRGTFGKDVTVGEDRTVWVIANTDDVDLQREVVVPAGADTSYFFRNKNIFLDHDTRYDSLVGRLRTPMPWPNNRTFSAWKVGVFVLDTPLGNDVLTLAREGALGVSIGFIPLDWGRPNAEEVRRYTRDGEAPESIVRTWKWLELSFTPFPCNVSCQAVGKAQRDESRRDRIDRLLTKGLIRRETADLLGVGTRTKTPRKIVCRVQ